MDNADSIKKGEMLRKKSNAAAIQRFIKATGMSPAEVADLFKDNTDNTSEVKTMSKARTMEVVISEIKKDIDSRRAVEAAAQQVHADALAALDEAREAKQSALDSGSVAALISADAEVNLCQYRIGKASIALEEAAAAPLLSPEEGKDYLQRILDAYKSEALPLYEALAEAVATCEKITAQLVDASTRTNAGFSAVESAYPVLSRSKGYPSMEFRPVLVDRVISGAFYGDPAVMGRAIQKSMENLQDRTV